MDRNLRLQLRTRSYTITEQSWQRRREVGSTRDWYRDIRKVELDNQIKITCITMIKNLWVRIRRSYFPDNEFKGCPNTDFSVNYLKISFDFEILVRLTYQTRDRNLTIVINYENWAALAPRSCTKLSYGERSVQRIIILFSELVSNLWFRKRPKSSNKQKYIIESTVSGISIV